MSVILRTEKFNIVSNDHERRHKCNFSVFDQKYPLWKNLVQNIKTDSLRWNSWPSPIQICRAPWWFALFFATEIPFFWANLVQKIKIISLNWNLVPRLIRICRIQWWFFIISVLDWKQPFWTNLVQKSKFSVWAEIWYLD